MHALLSGPLTVERVTVPIRNLPSNLHGTTLVQLSDLHFDGLRLSHELLEAAIALSNQIFPDLVMLTGDFVTQSTDPVDELAAYLQQLQSRYGTYAVLGNHDSITTSQQRRIINALSAVDITVLWNEIAYPLGQTLPVVGFADLWSRQCRPHALLAQLDPAIPRLVLAHNPDTAELLQSLRADLQLSGHTHGGQVQIPGLGSLPTLVQKARPFLPQWIIQRTPYLKDGCDSVVRHWEWVSGLHQVGSNYLYVNRGLGTYLPGRFFCPPELTVLTLVAQ